MMFRDVPGINNADGFLTMGKFGNHSKADKYNLNFSWTWFLVRKSRNYKLANSQPISKPFISATFHLCRQPLLLGDAIKTVKKQEGYENLHKVYAKLQNITNYVNEYLRETKLLESIPKGDQKIFKSYKVNTLGLFSIC